jgi:hypothetical protein
MACLCGGETRLRGGGHAASTVPERPAPTWERPPTYAGTMRLQADADPMLWVPVTDSLGFGGRRHRKAAIRMLLTQANRAMGQTERPASGFLAWGMSQAAPFLMKRAGGRVLVWVWKADPELLVVMAQIQEATSQLRAARAMMPMEYDDTESFRNPHLGIGEKLAMPLPADSRTPPFATYTWDTGTHFVTITAVCADRERFGIVMGSVDDLARTLRVVEDLAIGESAEFLRIDPA